MTYVGSEFRNGDDLGCLIRDLKNPEADLISDYTPKKPKKQGVDVKDRYNDFEYEEWKMEQKMFLETI